MLDGGGIRRRRQPFNVQRPPLAPCGITLECEMSVEEIDHMV